MWQPDINIYIIVIFHKSSNFNNKKALRAGFEPTRGDPNGFQVHRLNHSAIAAVVVLMTKEFKYC